MTHMIRIIEADSRKHRLLILDVFTSHITQSSRMFRIIGCLLVISKRQRIHQMLDTVPFIQTTDFRLRIGLSQQPENSRKDIVFGHHPRGKLRCFRSPLRIPVQLRTGTHKHRSPVHRTRRRQHSPFLQGISNPLHQPLNIRHICLFHTVETPSIQSIRITCHAFLLEANTTN